VSTCRVCGCTDARPCVFDPETGGPAVPGGPTDFCRWIEFDLCSRCTEPATPLVFDVDGNPLRGAP
jgi:hypothetical protein